MYFIFLSITKHACTVASLNPQIESSEAVNGHMFPLAHREVCKKHLSSIGEKVLWDFVVIKDTRYHLCA